MLIAAMAGIPVFATGGIGGVHRGAETSFDISADIEELARTPVCVVCAGAKSILDLPKTLEALETRGVPVWGHGTDELPAFFARSSGLKLDRRFDGPEEIAAALAMQRALGFPPGRARLQSAADEVAMPARRSTASWSGRWRRPARRACRARTRRRGCSAASTN